MRTKILIHGRLGMDRTFRAKASRSGKILTLDIPLRKRALIDFFQEWFRQTGEIEGGYKANIVVGSYRNLVIFLYAFPVRISEGTRRVEVQFMAQCVVGPDDGMERKPLTRKQLRKMQKQGLII